MSKLYINQTFNATTQDQLIFNHTNDYISNISLLTLQWLTERPTRNLRLSLIHKKWLYVRPVKFTRAEIKTAINVLSRAGFIKIQPVHKPADLLLTLICEQKK